VGHRKTGTIIQAIFTKDLSYKLPFSRKLKGQITAKTEQTHLGFILEFYQ
jgi:hypothetical protein